MQVKLDPKALGEALVEIGNKPLREIQLETAVKWCYRALAAASLGHDEDAREYAHEAIEHAALCGHDDVLRWVRAACAQASIGL